MHELGIESSILKEILEGRKTIEGRLGKPDYLKLRAGDILKLREDTWVNGKIVKTESNKGAVKITQILYFNTFYEMLNSVGVQDAIPGARSIEEAVGIYRKFYTLEDEEEFGVMAIYFELL
jgi:ASC-1-like (ASCH) protein